MGYKTCHVLNSSLDATACAKDCDRLKKQDFATKCRDKGGLFKCCIRRDAAFCHECRYLVLRCAIISSPFTVKKKRSFYGQADRKG